MNITIGRKDAEPLRFNAKSNEKVLHAALRNRIAVPYECATGTCGSCRAKLVSGELADCWQDAPGKKALKIKRGEFLMCQCVAETDCEIRIPTPVAQQVSQEAAPESLPGVIGNFDRLTVDVLSFRVSLQQSVEFKAGQFMLLQLPGIEGTRAYSMVNYAPQTKELEFVIKQFKGGECSEWLFDPPAGSSEITLFGPLGHAVFQPKLQHDLLLLAGGSGIAGMMAILEQADQIGYLRNNSIDLIFGVRTAADVFYLSELRHLTGKHSNNLQVIIALSEGGNQTSIQDLAGGSTNLKIATRGFVHEHIDASRVTSNTMAFIAGPPPMVDASIRELIAGCELEVDQIRYDKFA